MAIVSRFRKRRPIINIGGVALDELNFFNLGGLNTFLPDELMKDDNSPYARNFRKFDTDTQLARTCISKRKGHTLFAKPFVETEGVKNDTITPDMFEDITPLKRLAIPFKHTDRLSAVSFRAKNINGTAPLRVDIYTKADGKPDKLVASSSVAQADIPTSVDWVTARFIEAPLIDNKDHFIVLYQQKEGTGVYKIGVTDTTTTTLKSTDAGNNWVNSDFSANFKTLKSPDAPVKSIFKFYRSNGAPITLAVVGGTLYSINEATKVGTQIIDSLDPTAENYFWVNLLDKVYFVNGKDKPKVYDGTSVTDLTGVWDTNQVKAIDLVFHKNCLWVLLDDNSIVISEEMQFGTFLHDRMIYSHQGSDANKAIRIIPFQDNIVAMGRAGKMVIYGRDPSTFVARESTSNKPLISPNAVWLDGSYIYFLSNDNVYRFNGGIDEPLGLNVDRLVGDMATKLNADLVVHKDKIRLYYTPSGASHNKDCLIYDMRFKEWLHDDEIYVGTVAILDGQNDENILLHGSSLTSAIYRADEGLSDLGKPIMFDYWTKYFSYSHPSRKNRIKRLYPFFRAGDGDYNIEVQIAIDDTVKPQVHQVPLGAGGVKWGSDAEWGDGSKWGAGILKPRRLTVPGQYRKHQIRFVQHGVDNPVDIIGYTQYVQVRKPL